MGRLTIVIASIADLVLRAELYSILTASVHGGCTEKGVMRISEYFLVLGKTHPILVTSVSSSSI